VHALRFAEFAAPPGTRTPGMEDLLRRLDGLGFALIEADFNRGYIGNYILFREIAAALQLIDRHHYTSRAIDEVLKRMGRPVSLFEIIDLVGVDVTLRIIQNLRGEDPSIHLSPLLQRAVSEGILGRKNQTSLRTLVDAPRP
jgi:3-hydroxyacyl-CoA dehydrogenase